MDGPAVRTSSRLATATRIDFDDAGFRVRLSDGRTLHFDFDEFAFLRAATPEGRRGGVVAQKGTVLWWDELLDGISVAGLIGVSETALEDFADVYRSSATRTG